MAKHLSGAFKATSLLHLFLLVITLTCANSARVLVDEDVDPTVLPLPPVASIPVTTPVDDVAPGTAPVDDVAPVAGPVATTPIGTGPTVAATGAAVAQTSPQTPPPLSFFMHDILGGTTPSARVVAGTIVSNQANGLPFSKTNGGVFPISGGVPLLNGNNGGINNNNNPFLSGINGGGQTSTIINNNGNNNVVTNQNRLPFVIPGNLPGGATLQQLLFGTITVIEDELTEGHELGSSVLGSAQGFYLASSLDGSSQTMALTALFHNGEHEEDTLSFFGVHRTAAHESLIAIVGGTGKYVNAGGYATIQTLHLDDQHITDGAETLLQITVYIS